MNEDLERRAAELAARFEERARQVRTVPMGSGEWQYACVPCHTRWVGFAAKTDSHRFALEHGRDETCAANRGQP
jgi:hypothetical protein